ncbi:MAG: hypothetical protein H7Y00_12510 [Fimbriimonadaceae bacterium]|nr:hypothetical protein [Chitinophagales bacterium]
MTLAAITNILRKRITEYRHNNRINTSINEAINLIEIALNVTELGISNNRAIEISEEHWFEPDWKIIYALEKTEWDDLIDLYRELDFKVKERNWFRS